MLHGLLRAFRDALAASIAECCADPLRDAARRRQGTTSTACTHRVQRSGGDRGASSGQHVPRVGRRDPIACCAFLRDGAEGLRPGC